MLKRLFIIAAALSATACASFFGWLFGDAERQYICPEVEIDDTPLEIAGAVRAAPAFEISAAGFEGFCYTEEKSGLHKAVMAPTIAIRRLAPSDETDVHFSYYIETLQGPPQFLGKKRYHAKASIPAGEGSSTVKLPMLERVIPGDGGIDLKFGLSPKL